MLGMNWNAQRRAGLRKWGLRSLLALGLLGVIFTLKQTVFASKPIDVRVVRTERGLVESTITNSKAGTVKARQRAKLSAEISGRIVEITRRKGESVAQGDTLVRLSDDSLRAQKALAEQAVHAAEARLREAYLARDFAKRELERKQKLAEHDIVSAERIDQLENSFDSAQAVCVAAEAERKKAYAALDVTQADFEKLSIRAPFPGVIAEVSTEVGEWVGLPTTLGIIDLINPDSLYISAPMDEVDSGKISVGAKTKISVDSRPDEKFLGHVTRIAPYVLDLETQNRTVEIEAELDDPEISKTLLPGTSADVEVILIAKPNALRIPTSALFRENRVLVIEGGVLTEREIQTGLRNWDFVEVTGGLQEGEEVVTSLDRSDVKAGRRAKVSNETKNSDGKA